MPRNARFRCIYSWWESGPFQKFEYTYIILLANNVAQLNDEDSCKIFVLQNEWNCVHIKISFILK